MYNWENKTIVIVEDIDFNFLLMKKQLRNTNANIVWLKNGQESVDYVKNDSKVDVILMDVRMPIMDGIEATNIIKELKPEIPIIMQTACVIGNDYAEVKNSSCDDYIFKPIITKDLLDMINKYIK